MYISIKLPPSFGSFNKLRKENYPFNNLFTSYLAAISRLGLSLQMDVDELVGYIEDRVFDGKRVPDIPDGNEPVNVRYKTEDPDVVKYISDSSLTNRMAVMYIARMTLRLSEAYGTSLLRLTKLINDMSSAKVREPKKEAAKLKEQSVQKSKPVQKTEIKESEQVPEMPMPRISSKAPEKLAVPVIPEHQSPAAKSAEAAKAALNALNTVIEEAEQSDTDTNDGPIVETNPFLQNFL